MASRRCSISGAVLKPEHEDTKVTRQTRGREVTAKALTL